MANNKWVFLCEGEKDCSTLAKAGFVATTFGGSSDLPAEALKYFKDMKVFICGDYDKAGAKRVKATYDALLPIAKEVRHAWLQEPLQSEAVNDVTDWFSHGGTVEKLRDQVKAAKEYEQMTLKPTHTIFTYDDILQMPPPRWLVSNYLLENSTAMLIGPECIQQTYCMWQGKGAVVIVRGSVLGKNITRKISISFIYCPTRWTL